MRHPLVKHLGLKRHPHGQLGGVVTLVHGLVGVDFKRFLDVGDDGAVLIRENAVVRSMGSQVLVQFPVSGLRALVFYARAQF